MAHRTNLLLTLLLIAGRGSAQEPGLFIYGKVDDLITAAELEGVRVSVQEVGADTSTRIYSPITTGQLTYEFTLSEQGHYEVRAEAPGKISKYVLIDARGVPPKSWSDGHGINLDIALLDSIHGHDLSMFNAPYAVGRYKRGTFRFDIAGNAKMRDYTQALLKKTGQKMAPRPRQ
ncbi:MAG: hypothetical protein JNJ91_05910 [Flavobacteriales bacterium]|nr:hypothetical protein [Flavobacteriales bacterium]